MIRPYNTYSMSLADAARLIGASGDFDSTLTITGIANSDKDALPGDIFCAFSGEKTHGAHYAQSAISKGAVAVLTDAVGASQVSGVPVLVVSEPRVAAAVMASRLYRDPISNLESIGVTGTNGKTTVTTLLFQIFTGIGRESGLIGTVETRIGEDVIPSIRTTPEAAELQSLAATMQERHIRHCIMEVSSHALELKRMVGSHFRVVGFTNLTQDHLDFHADMESYYRAKAKLFTQEYAETGFVNIDGEYGSRLVADSEIETITLSRLNTDATWHFVEISHSSSRTDFLIRGRDGVLIHSHTSLQGDFNLDNLLMAVAIAYHFDVDPLQLEQIIPTLTGAPGRMQPVALGQDFKAIVDYAHSPDAVKNVLANLRNTVGGKIIAVLGCGGDRDASKRPLMGRELLDGSDIAIFTSDNPRSEDPARILSDMTVGLEILDPTRIISDRKEAIAYAISLASTSDCVVVLGKGHEKGQEIMGEKLPFDDVKELALAIEARS